jgi:ribosome-associated protein
MRSRARRVVPEAKPLATEEKLAVAESALVDHRAVDPVRLDMRAVTLITDYFVICHGTSSVHIRGLADAVVEALEQLGLRASGVEGHREARWILLDYGDVVIHIFAEEERSFYDLERLWSDAPQVAIAAPEQQ